MPAAKKKIFLREAITQCIGFWIPLIIILLLAVNGRTPSVEQALQDQQYESELEDYEKALRKVEAYSDELIGYNEYLLEKYNLNKQGQLKVKVEIHTEKLNTEGIGNEISYLYSINGATVRDGETVTFNVLEPVKIFTEIRDSDPSHDDVGSATYEEIMLISNLADGARVLQNVDVHESYGRDAGNTAKYQVSYMLEMEKSINISSSDLREIPARPTAPEAPERADIDVTLWQTVQQDRLSQVFVICGGCVFVLLTIGIYNSRRNEAKEQYEKELEEKKRREKQQEELQKRLEREEQERKARLEKEEQERKRRFEDGRAACLAKLGGRSIRDVAGVPPHIKFIEGDLPVDNNDSQYGSFTVYRSRSGTRYHCKRGCSSAYQAIHLFTAKKYNLTPCRVCGRAAKIPFWYAFYLELKKECKKYKIDGG